MKDLAKKQEFDILLACNFGIQEAILIRNFQEIILQNTKDGSYKKEGKTWAMQTLKDIVSKYPFFINRHRVMRAINNLVAKKVIITKQLSTGLDNKTTWYAFADEKEYIKNFKN